VLGLALLMTQAVVVQSAPQFVPTRRDASPHQVRWDYGRSSVRLEVLDWGGSGRPLVLLGCYLTAHVHDAVRAEADESVPCLRHHTTRHRCVR
jgi:hypothetical protein